VADWYCCCRNSCTFAEQRVYCRQFANYFPVRVQCRRDACGTMDSITWKLCTTVPLVSACCAHSLLSIFLVADCWGLPLLPSSLLWVLLAFFLLILNSIICSIGSVKGVNVSDIALGRFIPVSIFLALCAVYFIFHLVIILHQINILFCLWIRDIANQRLLCLRFSSQ